MSEQTKAVHLQRPYLHLHLISIFVNRSPRLLLLLAPSVLEPGGLLGLLVGPAGLLFLLLKEPLLLLLDDLKYTNQAIPPHVEPARNLSPLVLAKDAVCGAVDQECLVELAELALNESGADHIDDPHLNVFAGNLQRLCNLLVRERPLLTRRRGDRGECEEANLAVESIVVEAGLLDPAVVLVLEVVEIVYNVRVEDLKELKVDGFGVAERLNRVEVGEVLEVEVAGVGQGGLQRAERQLLGLWRRCLLRGECAERAKEVCVCLLVLSCSGSRVADCEVKLALLLLFYVPCL